MTDYQMLQTQIQQWRTYLSREAAMDSDDIDELEDHLHGHLDLLTSAGLSPDEAFLVAVKRIGDVNSLSREFAVAHSERLWRQLVLSSSNEHFDSGNRRLVTAVGFAIAAALVVKIPALFGVEVQSVFYAINLSLFILPVLAAYLIVQGEHDVPRWPLVASFLIAAAIVNGYPLAEQSDTTLLTILHLPIALWLVVGLAYTGERWYSSEGRMDFVRFSGELAIYYALLALGGGVLMAFTMAMFDSIGVDASGALGEWILPCGAMGAVIIGTWLVEAKKSVIENMAPVLTRVFTPLVTLVLLTFLATMLFTGHGIDVERDVLIAFDLLLVLVTGLVIYAASARGSDSPPDVFDWLQLLLIVSAVIVDLLALAAIAARITEYGVSPNKLAALSENLILLVNLLGAAYVYLQFIRRRFRFTAMVQWQTSFLPIYAGWAATVVLVFPPLFGFR
ncbi:MAG: permease prefix domain 1-containing protein [Proteobacteria bacterium]|nr:permease prefix domain 1-containing protein [Pseudomonadota bacterium]